MWHGKCIPSSCVLQKRKPGKGHELWRGPYLCLEALFALSAHALYKGTRPSLPSCWGSRYKLLYLKQITNRTNCSRERCSVLCGGLDGRGFGGEWTHGYCMAESLWCPLETITTLLIGWTPIQNKKLNKIQEKKKALLHLRGDLVELYRASLRPRSLQTEVPSSGSELGGLPVQSLLVRCLAHSRHLINTYWLSLHWMT